METKFSRFTLLFFVILISLAVCSNITYSQQKQKVKKDQAAVTKDEIPITTSSQAARAKYIEGRDLLENAMDKKAKEAFQAAIDADPNIALGYYGLAQISGYAEAKRNYDKAESFSNNISEGEKNLIAFHRALWEGNIPKAQDGLKQLLSMFPKDKHVYILAGYLESSVNQNHDAVISYMKKAIAIDKNYTAAYNWLGLAYWAKNDFKNAEAALKKYISLMPDEPNPYDSYGYLLLSNGKYDQSIEQYKKALEKDPSFAFSLEGLGNNYLFKNDLTKARGNYQELFDKAPDVNWKLVAMNDQAASYLREGDINGALSILDKRISFAKQEGSSPSEIYTHNIKGVILAETGKTDDAMKEFDIASEKLDKSDIPDNLKNNFAGQFKISKIYGMALAGKLDEAKAELQKKDEIIGSSSIPENEKLFEYTSGIISLKQGKFDDAISQLQKADNENPMTWYYMSQAYEKKGDSQKAQEMIDKIHKSNQNSWYLGLAYNLTKETVAKKK